MAQSHNGSVIDDTELGASFDRGDLPEGEARLVIHDDGVTTVIQGDAAKVRRRFEEYLPEGDATVEEYPMPDSDDGLVSADEFYSDE
jgi:hypothetical protein